MIVSGYPHFVGTHIRQQQTVVTINLLYIVQHLLWLDQANRVIVAVTRQFLPHVLPGTALLLNIEFKTTDRTKALVEHGEVISYIAHQLDFRVVGGVDLCWQEIDMNNCFVTGGVPQLRVVLHHVKTDGYYKVCGINGTGADIFCPQTHGVQTLIRVVIHRALGHKCIEYSDTGRRH